jgi:hypothetical protein
MTLFGAIIRHERNMDVCYDVVKCFDVGDRLKLKVQCVNMGYVNSYNLNILSKIEIDKKNIASWSECEDRNVKCLRYAKWSKLK